MTRSVSVRSRRKRRSWRRKRRRRYNNFLKHNQFNHILEINTNLEFYNGVILWCGGYVTTTRLSPRQSSLTYIDYTRPKILGRGDLKLRIYLSLWVETKYDRGNSLCKAKNQQLKHEYQGCVPISQPLEKIFFGRVCVKVWVGVFVWLLKRVPFAANCC